MAELLAEFKYLIPLELISCVRRFHLCNMHSSCIFHVYTVYGFSFDASFVLVPNRRVVFTWFLSRPESCACVPVPDLVVCTRFCVASLVLGVPVSEIVGNRSLSNRSHV